MPLSHEDIREILKIIDESELDELRIETPGFSLHVGKSANLGLIDSAHAVAAGGAPMTAPAEVEPDAPPVSAGDTPAPVSARDIEAPMLGTFYRSESPGERPFVDAGARVGPDTVVGLIEVMKLMNHIQAGIAGTISEVLVDNATLVEFGQPLFRVVPDP
jgi:acetyl-CoA carboxylase biotin carboxyl carrier protein